MSAACPANQRIVDVLQQAVNAKQGQLSALPRKPATAAEARQKQELRFSTRALQKAVSAIAALDFHVTDAEQLQGLADIGAGTIRRVDELLRIGTLAELTGVVAVTSPAGAGVADVAGIGPALAHRLRAAGVHTVQQLRQALTAGQVVVGDAVLRALPYHEDLQLRIPRPHMDAFARVLAQAAAELAKSVKLEMAGSYRRGVASSGDIDVLLGARMPRPQLLDDFERALRARGMLKARMDSGDSKMTLLVALPGLPTVRHMDVRLVPTANWGAALLYFTGSKCTNVRMRRRAMALGLRLSEYGLEDKRTGEMLRARTEQDIFRRLGMEYLRPDQR